MRSVLRLLATLLVLSSLLALAPGALAVASRSAPGTVAAAQEVPQPAVTVPPPDESEPDPEWTFRYLVPATVLLGLLAVVVTVVQYFVRVVRTRYRVVK